MTDIGRLAPYDGENNRPKAYIAQGAGSVRRPQVICLMQKKFTRSYDSLEKIFEFTERFFEKEHIEESMRYPVHFVMEELFTNMVKYNPASSSDILLNVDKKNSAIRVSLTDFDVDAFDVTTAREVDTESPVQERKIGGLGLHLIQQMVDSLEYDYKDRRSTITFTKEFASTDV